LRQLPLNFVTGVAEILGQLRSSPWDILEHHLENEARYGVEVSSECLATYPKRL
jgi:hypothetical protein